MIIIVTLQLAFIDIVNSTGVRQHVSGATHCHNQAGSHITLQPKTGYLLKLSRAEPGQYLDGRPGKTRLLLKEVSVRPPGGAHPVVCVGPTSNAPVL